MFQSQWFHAQKPRWVEVCTEIEGNLEVFKLLVAILRSSENTKSAYLCLSSKQDPQCLLSQHTFTTCSYDTSMHMYATMVAKWLTLPSCGDGVLSAVFRFALCVHGFSSSVPLSWPSPNTSWNIRCCPSQLVVMYVVCMTAGVCAQKNTAAFTWNLINFLCKVSILDDRLFTFQIGVTSDHPDTLYICKMCACMLLIIKTMFGWCIAYKVKYKCKKNCFTYYFGWVRVYGHLLAPWEVVVSRKAAGCKHLWAWSRQNCHFWLVLKEQALGLSSVFTYLVSHWPRASICIW